MEPRKLTNVLLGIGVSFTAIAFLWWMAFYGKVTNELGMPLGEAISCLYSSGGECGLVSALAQFGDVTPYSPLMLWVGIALVGAGLIVRLSQSEDPPIQES